ncbi:Hypothetical protein P9303_29331 [Prochlorococcus marinus str. MIT 9303]|uniref:Uncharacterized protein n=1 Tax=Prochlorococcus marinus (strain MIT 9303) TaxID=59922 RepID=A2CDV3_PROM3|nr:Hypothetical protein P9303_29331 [Prochlorococcus marinus str. MIT 9303]
MLKLSLINQRSQCFSRQGSSFIFCMTIGSGSVLIGVLALALAGLRMRIKQKNSRQAFELTSAIGLV